MNRQELLDLALLFFGKLDRGPTAPAVGKHEPIADRHGGAAFGTGAKDGAAIEPDFAGVARADGNWSEIRVSAGSSG